MDSDTFSKVFPICGIDLYPSGTAVVRRECLLQSSPQKRGKVTSLSRKSLYRLLFLVKETSLQFASLLTLTYPADFERDGSVVKRHLNRLLTWLRRRLAVEYVWFLEFQRRGAPHFHVLLTQGATTGRREEIASQWSKIVGKTPEERNKVYMVHRHPTAWEDIRDKDGATHYVAKYASKWDQKDVPDWYSDVGRMWAASRAVRQAIPTPVPVECGEDELRGMLHEDRHPARTWEYLPKYIFARNGVGPYYGELTRGSEV